MQHLENITLIGASKVKTTDFKQCLRLAPVLIAADGGAKIAVKLGQTPEKVIGDFDSIDENTLSQIPANRLLKLANQNTTDFEKCLEHISAPLILALGFLGKRVDHQLAALHTLVQNPHQACILIGKHDVIFHLPAEFKMQLPIGTRFSLFPLAPVVGTSVGLEWSIKGLDFAPDRKIGTSNMATETDVSLRMDNAGMLAILPRDTLTAVIEALPRFVALGK